VTEEYEISADLHRINVKLVHLWLSTDAYWGAGRSLETVERSINASLNFGAYDADGVQVAFARIVTDYATFAWLCDVYVDHAARGRGIGTRLVQAVVDQLAPYRLKRILLGTRDAHGLYAKVGFTPLPRPETMMVLLNPGATAASS
jgi:GNAT superfamily N-acetyltransferase